MEKYDIHMNDAVVGTATSQQIGLFTQYVCCCKPADKGIYRIVAVYDDKVIDLGICIQEGPCYRINTKVPTKRLGKGTPGFFLRHNKDEFATVIPLSSNTYFPQLHRIDKGIFVIENERAGIRFANDA